MPNISLSRKLKSGEKIYEFIVTDGTIDETFKELFISKDKNSQKEML